MGNLRSTSWIARFGAKGRLGTPLAVAAVAFVVQPDAISWHTRAVASWDLGTLARFDLVWMLIGWTDARDTRDHALSQDQSGYVISLYPKARTRYAVLPVPAGFPNSRFAGGRASRLRSPAPPAG